MESIKILTFWSFSLIIIIYVCDNSPWFEFWMFMSIVIILWIWFLYFNDLPQLEPLQDLNTLALGSDLTTFGLNLNSSDCLYSSFRYNVPYCLSVDPANCLYMSNKIFVNFDHRLSTFYCIDSKQILSQIFMRKFIILFEFNFPLIFTSSITSSSSWIILSSSFFVCKFPFFRATSSVGTSIHHTAVLRYASTITKTWYDIAHTFTVIYMHTHKRNHTHTHLFI